MEIPDVINIKPIEKDGVLTDQDIEFLFMPINDLYCLASHPKGLLLLCCLVKLRKVVGVCVCVCVCHFSKQTLFLLKCSFSRSLEHFFFFVRLGLHSNACI